MKNLSENNFRTCGCCHRKLSKDEFYLIKRTQRYDNYCKECRKSTTANHYRSIKFVNRPRTYPIITRIADPTLRMSLILHALQTINESIARKQQKVREEEYY